MGSSRLPGKVLAPLAGRPVLEWVVRAARTVPGIDAAVVATSTRNADDPIALWGSTAGVPVFRGDEQDVLGRYAAAAVANRATVVARITADCPFLDPEVAGRVVALLGSREADYASNLEPRSWPDGLDFEIFSAEALARAAAMAKSPAEREHVTTYIRDPANEFHRVHLDEHRPSLADERWTLDTHGDLAFLQTVAALLPADAAPSYRDVLAILERYPHFRDLRGARSEPSRASLVTLRRARPADSGLLLAWRNDPETAAASRNQTPILPAEHENWFRSSMADPRRLIFIAESDGRPVGTLRADAMGDGHELSWAVAPEERRRGFGEALLRNATTVVSGKLMASIRASNAASLKIAVASGFAVVGRQGEFLRLVRDGGGTVDARS